MLTLVLCGLLAPAGLAWARTQDPPPQNPPPASQTPPPPGQRPGRLGPRGQRMALPPDPGANPNDAELQAWLNAYALVQAQKELQLSDEQYGPFIQRLQQLQNVRRRQQMERMRILRDLRPLAAPNGTVDEAAIQDKLKALDGLIGQSAQQLQQAYANLDQILTPRQRARFRLFEERLEQRKLELLSRVRQGGGGPIRGGGSAPRGPRVPRD